MDQIKIGKFIASCRKEQGMTQAVLAEKLGDVFVGALFVAAQVKQTVSVANDAFPIVFKQGLELADIL